MQINPNYLFFYLDGREAEIDDDELDVDELVKKAMRGPDDIHTVAYRAVEALVTPSAYDREKRTWLTANKAEIKEAGGDAELAWSHYQKGCIDGAVYELEDEIYEGIVSKAGGIEVDDDGIEDEDDDEETEE